MTTGDDTSAGERNAKAAARMRKWRAANPLSPEQKAKAAEKSRKWRQANKERYSAYIKAWRDANRERLATWHSIYNKTRRQRAALKKEANKNGLPHHEEPNPKEPVSR
ncbi:hypothetical protein [Phyllobacterium zundukense]|uniref:Uncharacterized protein n=1 Tax=Phyllobacterium zundukense TaxID=1867719 RepID=A0ACD4CXU4_9HYPH|nr:hypothetical protein [Phyllobacterium zundukense]UXN58278.1 hypothetical protein N8E88_05580 [Phyllobacterium zundukense]